MKLCKRNSNDPLLRTFVDHYGLHLLPIPREKISLGDLFVTDGKNVSAPGNIKDLLTPPIKIPKKSSNEEMGNIAGKFSNSLNFQLGLNLLENFLRALGVGDAALKLELGFNKNRNGSVRFAFQDPRRDSANVILMGTELIKTKIDSKHPIFNPGYKYYLTTATVKSSSISISTESADSNQGMYDLSAFDAVRSDGKVQISASQDGAITFQGSKSLIFGVELHELELDEQSNSIYLTIPDSAITVRTKQTDLEIPTVLIGGETGDAFLDYSDKGL
ncbi:MAG TPA: hypothetical protein VFI33_04325 [Puia sp.]|nr:hypothetical protein [Puia sp.]